MAGNILTVNDDSFENEVLKSNTPTLVDFWAEWCGPCKALAPKIDALAGQFAGKVKIVKVNIDDAPNVPARFGVRGIPTLILFKDGKIIDTLVGNQPAEKLTELVNKAL